MPSKATHTHKTREGRSLRRRAIVKRVVDRVASFFGISRPCSSLTVKPFQHHSHSSTFGAASRPSIGGSGVTESFAMIPSGRTTRAPAPMPAARRAPIPRPWLAEHHHKHPLQGSYPLHHDYRYVPSAGAPHGYPMGAHDPALDLLPTPDWKVSWNKLSCCFCMRSQRASGGNKNVQEVQKRRGHNDNFPFPAFPIIRRNSSSSLKINDNDIYPVSHDSEKFLAAYDYTN
jgi:hypothetical protein